MTFIIAAVTWFVDLPVRNAECWQTGTHGAFIKKHLGRQIQHVRQISNMKKTGRGQGRNKKTAKDELKNAKPEYSVHHNWNVEAKVLK